MSVAPGRGALESMATGTPTIAVGSKGYYGPTWRNIRGGMHSNFGGVATGPIDGAPILDDLGHLKFLTPPMREGVGLTSRKVASAFFDQSKTDDALAAPYEIHLVGRSAVTG